MKKIVDRIHFVLINVLLNIYLSGYYTYAAIDMVNDHEFKYAFGSFLAAILLFALAVLLIKKFVVINDSNKEDEE